MNKELQETIRLLQKRAEYLKTHQPTGAIGVLRAIEGIKYASGEGSEYIEKQLKAAKQ